MSVTSQKTCGRSLSGAKVLSHKFVEECFLAFVSGHKFCSCRKARKIKWASAPAGRFSIQCDSFHGERNLLSQDVGGFHASAHIRHRPLLEPQGMMAVQVFEGELVLPLASTLTT
jgi:hypothetical protein